MAWNLPSEKQIFPDRRENKNVLTISFVRYWTKWVVGYAKNLQHYCVLDVQVLSSVVLNALKPVRLTSNFKVSNTKSSSFLFLAWPLHRKLCHAEMKSDITVIQPLISRPEHIHLRNGSFMTSLFHTCTRFPSAELFCVNFFGSYF